LNHHRDNVPGDNPDTRCQTGRPSRNPAGRPKGCLNKTTIAIKTLLDGDAEAITQAAINAAEKGDVTAIRLCMDRIDPPRRDRYVSFRLPKIAGAADTLAALSAIAEAVANAELTLEESEKFVKLVEAFSRAIELSSFDERLAKLEERAADGRPA
jgi:Family of unknown function (DUF5681)